MVPIATLIVAGIDLATEIQQRCQAEDDPANAGKPPSSRLRLMQATMDEFRETLAASIREHRDLTPAERDIWYDRIQQDRAKLRKAAKD